MKSKLQKRNEANARAARNAQLSNEQKLDKAMNIVSGGVGECRREQLRLVEKILVARAAKHDRRVERKGANA